MSYNLRNRHFLTLRDFSSQEIAFLLKLSADLKAAKMEFEGLAMKDGQATFSRLLMSDVSLVSTDPEEAENGSGKIGSIELVNPSPEMAAWVASLFSEEDVADLPAVEFNLQRAHELSPFYIY